MSRELQQTGFEASAYQRPEQNWVCGWARAGRACARGPDPAGRCVVTHECLPVRQQDRWRCGRDPAFGGRCDGGPLPDGSCCRPIPRCQPVRSLRAMRGRVSRWMAAVTAGTLALAIAGSGGDGFVSPGPLATQHAALQDDCSRCHALEPSTAAWLGFAAAGPSPTDRCLACHELGAASSLPHGVPRSALQRSSDAVESSPDAHSSVVLGLARMGPGVPDSADGAIACATCHREHRGRNADLAALTDEQCQVCHSRAFASLADGHPPFGDYPYVRRTRIKFDHGTHRAKHFPTSDESPFSCIGCHQPESSGRTMRVLDFEQSCAGCHAGDVRGEGLRAGKKGLAVLNLPSLDLEALAEPDVLPIGEWPRSKRVAPSPFQTLLVSPDLTAGGDVVFAGLDLADLDDATSDEKNAVARYVWAVKSLLDELSKGGHAEIAKRLSPSAGREITLAEAGDLAGQIGREAIVAVQREWLPHLEKELALYRGFATESNQPLDSEGRFEAFREGLAEISAETVKPQRGPPDRKREDWSETGGWFLNKRSYSLRYRPRGHGDPFLRAWLDLSAGDSRADVFALLSGRNAPGRCAKCHSVDRVESAPESERSAGSRIQWRPFRPLPTEHPATEFQHRPHFSLDDPDRCLGCHSLDEKDFETARAELDVSYQGGDPQQDFVADFQPMDTATCAACHTPSAAGDTCVGCHNYHLGEFLPAYLSERRAD